jgi:ribonuclease E
MKRMLFNATQPEELRVAIVDGQKLIDLDIEIAGKEQRKSNIYQAVITRIEPSLEACFVEYGGNRHGFLPFKEVAPQFHQPGCGPRPSIREALREGQELLVQIEKDERGNKGAALTTYISLAGRYIVLMPNNPNGGGVSRRIEGDERTELREVLSHLEVPQGMSIIARTAGIGRNEEELQWDLNYLNQLWTAIADAAKSEKAPSLIYLESSLVVRAIRDYFNPEIGEILIDTDEVYHQAHAFMSTVMPDNVNRIKRYVDDVPLFSRFQIEHQIESAHSREVRLPSGGAIVIDHTEALTAIDINSARATKGSDIEATAFNTNLEAAEEIARQMRLRDLGGLIVIDFIDMENSKNQRDVENRLRDSLRFDRARVQTAKISRFGLLELSRQRLQPSLGESNYITCPRCSGIGHIRGTESSALHILRIIQEEAMKDSSAAIHAQVPVDVATFLLNEKRSDLHRIESRLKVPITLIPNPHLETPNYSINRLRQDELGADAQPSYTLVEKPEEGRDTQEVQKGVRAQAAVKGITPVAPAPMKAEQPVAVSSPSLLGQITGWFKSLVASDKPEEAPVAKPQRRPERAERGERPEGGNRKRRDRNDRPERAERPERADKSERTERPERADKSERTERPERADKSERSAATEKPLEKSAPAEARQPRPPRPPKKPNEPRVMEPVIETQLIAAPDEAETDTEKTEKSGSRRRGRRGGRREREKREITPGTEVAGTEMPENASTDTPVRTARPTEYIAMPTAMKSVVTPQVVATEPAAAIVPAPVAVEVPVPVAEIAVPAATAEVATPVVTEVATPPATEMTTPVATEVAAPVAEVTKPVAAPVQEAIHQESALVQIETAPEKIAAVVTDASAGRTPPVNRRRIRQMEVYVENEPLVQIETQHSNRSGK